MATVIAPVTLFMVGAGMASPFAVAGAVSVNPLAIGAASDMYGFVQMGYGVLCTVVVETWRPGDGVSGGDGAARLGAARAGGTGVAVRRG